MRPVRPQRGWAFIVVLIALAIVAFLARDALSAWLGGGRASPASGSRDAASPPATPVERARAVESDVAKQAEALRRGIDDAAR